MNKQLLEVVSLDIQEERRRRNKQLLDAVEGRIQIYNGEDAGRLVGELNAAYNHCVASLAGDGNIYCLLKHLCTAVVLAGEVDGDAEAIYQILQTISNGVIAPCKACQDEIADANAIMEEKEDHESEDNLDINLDAES